ncbi:hypothetical protein COM95_30930 [Bacillus cereus]|nr:hypothetical protein COM95_30930 [Bacillus cereus]
MCFILLYFIFAPESFCLSISLSDELQLFAQEIQNFLSPNFLRDFASDVGFVQRISKGYS